MTMYRQSHAVLVNTAITVLMCSVILFALPAQSQDTSWEGLIDAGQAALQRQNYSEAERQFEGALEVAEGFPSDDPRLGKSYNNLAAIYYAKKDYARAEPLMRRALEQLRRSLGTENTEVAQTMKNLAALYYLQGNRSDAESLLKQALATMETVHGPNHAYVATVLSNLAGLYQADGRQQEAEPLLVRSLEIWEKLLGPDHPDVSRSRNLLAKVQEANADAFGVAGSDPETPEPAPSNGAAAIETAENGPYAASPRALTALAAPNVALDEPNSELAKAASALEQLSRSSKSEIEGAAAASLPSPSSPVNGGDSTYARLDEAPESQTLQAPAQATRSIAQNAGDEALAATLKPSSPAATGLGKADAASDVSYAVYLSTLWSIEEARRYWSALRAAMPGVLDDKQMEIEEVAAYSGPDSFFRVLTSPFDSDPQAQETCEFIQRKLRTHDCEVVVRGKADG